MDEILKLIAAGASLTKACEGTSYKPELINQELLEVKEALTKRSGVLFEKLLDFANIAAAQDSAASIKVAIDTIKYVISVQHPEKYGAKVVNSETGVGGYFLETGIRRAGDAGFTESGTTNNEPQKDSSTISHINGSIEGQDDAE